MKKSQLIIIVILVVLIGVVITLRFASQNRQQAVSVTADFFVPPLGQTTAFSRVSFSGTTPDLPTALPLLTVSFSPNQSLLPFLDQYCQINSSDQAFYFGDRCDYYLFDDNQYLEVSTKAVATTELTVNLPKTLSQAELFLQQLFPGLGQVTLNQDQTRFLTGQFELAPTTLDKATVANLVFNYTYQQIPIMAASAIFPDFSFFYNSDLQLLKMTLITNYLHYSPELATHSLLSIDQALTQIDNNQAYLLNIGDSNFEQSSPLDIAAMSNISLDKVSLQYRFDQSTLIAIPSYLFSGTGTDGNGNQLDVEIITPAVNFTIVQ